MAKNHNDWKEIRQGIWDLECKIQNVPIDEDAKEKVRKASGKIKDSGSKEVVLYALDAVK